MELGTVYGYVEFFSDLRIRASVPEEFQDLPLPGCQDVVMPRAAPRSHGSSLNEPVPIYTTRRRGPGRKPQHQRHSREQLRPRKGECRKGDEPLVEHLEALDRKGEVLRVLELEKRRRDKERADDHARRQGSAAQPAPADSELNGSKSSQSSRSVLTLNRWESQPMLKSAHVSSRRHWC